MAKYTVELSDAEVKAMGVIAYSVQDWIDNAVHNRARLAVDEIYNSEVERMNADPNIDSIPADKDAVVIAADIKSAKEITDEASAETKE